MSCKLAMIDKFISLKPEQTVEQAMALLEEHRIRSAPVLDDQGRLMGMFGFHSVLTNILPVSVTMDDGLQRLDFVVGASSGVAKRLKKLRAESVEMAMDHKVVVVQPETPIWEGIRVVVKHGSPVPVVDPHNGSFAGLITEQSAIEYLDKQKK